MRLLPLSHAAWFGLSRPIVTLGVAVTLFVPSNAGAQFGPISYHLIAQTGQTPPGDTRPWVAFGAAAMSSSGGVAFFNGRLQPSLNEPTPHGIWLGTIGIVRPVAVTGMTAPDPSGSPTGMVFDEIYGSPNGYAIAARVRGAGITSANDQGIWKLVGRLYRFLKEGEQFTSTEAIAPDSLSGPVTFGVGLNNRLYPDVPVQTASGPVFTKIGELHPSRVYFPMARQNERAPFSSEVFHSFSRSFPDDYGYVFFHAILRDPTRGDALRHSIWYGGGEGMHPVAVVGEPVPGPAQGVTFAGSFSQINTIPFSTNPTVQAGEIAFLAQHSTNGMPDLQTLHLYSGTSRSIVRRLSEGTPAPGLVGSTLDDFDRLTFGPGSITLFSRLRGGAVTPDDDMTLWSLDENNSLKLLLREGQPTPGTTDGAVFNDQIADVFNWGGSGRIALVSTLRGPGVTADNDVAIFASKPGGELMLVAREGYPLPNDPGGKVIVSLEAMRSLPTTALSGDDTIPSFIDSAQSMGLAFSATFTDGTSAVYIAHIPGVPEPAALTLVAVAHCLLLSRGRRPKALSRANVD
jgi:hypothetical protein